MSKLENKTEATSYGVWDRIVIGVRWNWRYRPVKRMLVESLSECLSAFGVMLISLVLVPRTILALVWDVIYHFIGPIWFAFTLPDPDFWRKYKRLTAGEPDKQEGSNETSLED